MGAYHQAAFTIDPLHPIPDEPAPAVGVDEAGTADEIREAADAYAEPLAGPLSLGLEDSGLTLTATLEGAADADVALIDWGDGAGRDELTADGRDASVRIGSHTYSAAGAYNVAAVARFGTTDYGVCKVREMGSTP